MTRCIRIGPLNHSDVTVHQRVSAEVLKTALTKGGGHVGMGTAEVLRTSADPRDPSVSTLEVRPRAMEPPCNRHATVV